MHLSPLFSRKRFGKIVVSSLAVSVAMMSFTSAASAKAVIGMSAPADLWAKRLSEVGPGIKARRIFESSFTDSLTLPTKACNEGMTPVISFKTGGYSWAQVANGAADADLKALATKLRNLPCASYVVVHHEPDGDGNAADFTAMQQRALPILGGSLTDTKVKVGVIVNGFWWNSTWGQKSDAELDAWVGPKVRNVSDFIAADTYQRSVDAEHIAGKIKNLGAWARRATAKTPGTPVRALGIGEFNDMTGQGITDGMAAIKADPLYAFACVWNTDHDPVTILSGARLTAFRTALQNW